MRNGFRTSATRRRAHSSSSSSALASASANNDTYDDGAFFRSEKYRNNNGGVGVDGGGGMSNGRRNRNRNRNDDDDDNDDDRRRKQQQQQKQQRRSRRRPKNEPRKGGEMRRFVRRKGKNVSRAKLMCAKLFVAARATRVLVDVAFLVAASAKLASVCYERHHHHHRHRHDGDGDDNGNDAAPAMVTGGDAAMRIPEERGAKRRRMMPFRSPSLYRRTDDDGPFLRDSRLRFDPDDDDDYDGNGNGNGGGRGKEDVRFEGMLRASYVGDYYREKLDGVGYAVVDDLVYYADDYRESTMEALDESEFRVTAESSSAVGEEEGGWWFEAGSAFEFPDHEGDFQLYITDDDGWDEYYATDDDLVRGTRGMGTKAEEEEEEEAEAEEEREEQEEGDESKGEEGEGGERPGSGGPAERDAVCTRPSFYRTYRPTCNEFHASLSGYQWLLGEEIYDDSRRRWRTERPSSSTASGSSSRVSRYLSHGYYRDAFLYRQSFPPPSADDWEEDESSRYARQDGVVFKTMRHMYEGSEEAAEDDAVDEHSHRFAYDPEDKYTFINYQDDMRKDAMLMELLSSSPRAIDVYSHCAMSSVIEFAPLDMEEHVLPTQGYVPKKFARRGAPPEKVDGPLNPRISPEEKLEIALGMAECIAAMHGFEDGAIAHVDVQLGQFFGGRDGKIKIVDYNRAEPLLYDAREGRYCEWKNGHPADGSLRSPEENYDAPLTEKIDVYSLGNVFYSLLTGRALPRNVRGIRNGDQVPIPDFYDESPSSRLLVHAIRACWTYEVEDRPSIFRIVDLLEKAVAEYPVVGERSWG